MAIKIPENNKFYVSNGSDLTPNIQYTKCIDMDKEGYLRLSAPFVKITDDDVSTNFSIFADAIKIEAMRYKIVTASKVYNYEYNGGSFVPVIDATAPSGDPESRFTGWKYGSYPNRAYVNLAGDIWSWEHSHNVSPETERWTKENTDNIDYAETFVNRNTLVGASGNAIQQYLESDMNAGTPPSTNSGQTLTIPSVFEPRGLIYSNYRMGVITRNTAGMSAYFFVWDGSTADATQGFPVNAEIIIDCIAYKNSWVMYTSAGQVLFFNGNGFDVLGNLPVYYENADWFHYDFSLDHGKNMYTDGDVIYFHIGSIITASDDKNQSGLMKGFYSGIWCYDPDMGGIYHRYGLSNSQYIAPDIDDVAGVFTSTAHGLETGDRVMNSEDYKTYFAIKLTVDTFKMADSYALALAGTATSNGVYGPKWIQRKDWNQLTNYYANLGAIKKFQDKFSRKYHGLEPFFAGVGTVTPTCGYVNMFNQMAPNFDNIGTICYYKNKSTELEDNWNSIDVKYKKLTESDKIIVKYKYEDNYKQISIGYAGDESPARNVTWVDSTSFTVSNSWCNLSEVGVGDEVEFYQGAGAGSTAHILSCTLNTGIWTVVLDEAIRGAVAGNKSTCIFDSFKKVGEITPDNQNNLTNQTRFPIDLKSKWIQVKLELRGNNVTVEETIINNLEGSPIV